MKIIITILVVLLGLGGGAYYAQDSGMYDFNQLKQYIPSQVQEILNIEDTVVVSVESEELEAITDEVENQNSQVSTQDNIFGSDVQATGEGNQNPEESVYADMSMTANNTQTEKAHELASENNNQNIQTAMLDKMTAPQVENKAISAPEKKSSVQVLDASPEEMGMVKELNKIELKIVKLDNEKEILEQKYNQMIKKNRELALKIKEIDHQIKAIDTK